MVCKTVNIVASEICEYFTLRDTEKLRLQMEIRLINELNLEC